jgi:hypothetical protein
MYIHADVIIEIDGWVSGTHLLCPEQPYHGHTRSYGSLEDMLPSLVQGGYVIDLRPLAEHPRIVEWVVLSPMSSGYLEGDDLLHLSDEACQFGALMAQQGFDGAFQTLATSTTRADASRKKPGALDYVSSAYLAATWGERGARIGQRRGDVLYWSDGSQQQIF